MDLGFPAPQQPHQFASGLTRETECLPHQKEAGRAEICHGDWSGAVVLSPGSLLPCLYYRSQQPFSFSHGHLCLSDHSSLCIVSHSPSLQYTIPTVQVKNQFPHPPVLTTPARPLALSFSFFLLSFFHHLYVSKGRWQLQLCLIHSRGNICACF